MRLSNSSMNNTIERESRLPRGLAVLWTGGVLRQNVTPPSALATRPLGTSGYSLHGRDFKVNANRPTNTHRHPTESGRKKVSGADFSASEVR